MMADYTNMVNIFLMVVYLPVAILAEPYLIPNCASAKRFVIIFDDSIDPDNITIVQDEFVARLAKNLRSTFAETRVAVGVFSGMKTGFVESEFRRDNAFEQEIQDLEIIQKPASTIKMGIEAVENLVKRGASSAPVSVLFVIGSKGYTELDETESKAKVKSYFKGNPLVKGFVVGVGSNVDDEILEGIGGKLGGGRRWQVEAFKDTANKRTEVEKQLCKETAPHVTNNNFECEEAKIKTTTRNCYGYLVCKNKEWIEYKCWKTICDVNLDVTTLSIRNVDRQCTTADSFGYKYVPHTQFQSYPEFQASSGDNKPIYICRNEYGDTNNPGRLWELDYLNTTIGKKGEMKCFMPMPHTKPLRSNMFEVLVNPLGAYLKWEPLGDKIPENAVLGGYYIDGNGKEMATYVSRCEIQVKKKPYLLPGVLYPYSFALVGSYLKSPASIPCNPKRRLEILTCASGKGKTIKEGTSCMVEGVTQNERYGTGYFQCRHRDWTWVDCENNEVHVGAGVCISRPR